MNESAVEPSATTLKIRELNDQLRKTLSVGLGRVIMTATVTAMDSSARHELVRKFQNFEDNDPYGEHDFGMVEMDGQKYYFIIDYYDKNMEAGSASPEDPMVTCRVLTFMHSNEL